MGLLGLNSSRLAIYKELMENCKCPSLRSQPGDSNIWHISTAVHKMDFKFLPIDFPSEAPNPSQLLFQCHHKNVQL